MSKKLKELMEFIKKHKKESIGVAVALGIAVAGTSGLYLFSKSHLNNMKKNFSENVALAEKKNNNSSDLGNKENTPNDNEEEITDSDVVVEEQEDGTLIVKDKEGNTIADSSKGDDVTKVVAEKKEAGSNVAIKDKDGKVDKVDKVESGSITITGGGTVTVKPPTIADNTKPNEPSKPSENDKPNNSTGGNTESNNNPVPPVENNKPVEKPNTDNDTNNKPQEPTETPTPTPTPPVDEPVEKPQPPVETPKPQRTWEYQFGMSSELLNLISDFRQANGLNRLNHSGAMAQATKQHCEEMAKNGTSFHKNDADEWVQNVFSGNTVSTSNGILEKWKASSGHKQALLDEDITEGVCAVYKDSDGDYYAVFNGNF